MRTAVRLTLRTNGSNARPITGVSSAFSNASVLRSSGITGSMHARMTLIPGQYTRTLSTTSNISRSDSSSKGERTNRRESERSSSLNQVNRSRRDDEAKRWESAANVAYGGNQKHENDHSNEAFQSRTADRKIVYQQRRDRDLTPPSPPVASATYASKRSSNRGEGDRSSTSLKENGRSSSYQREGDRSNSLKASERVSRRDDEAKRWKTAADVAYGGDSKNYKSERGNETKNHESRIEQRRGGDRDEAVPAPVDPVSYSSNRSSTPKPTPRPKRNWGKHKNTNNNNNNNSKKEEASDMQFARRAEKVPYKPEPIEPTFVSRRVAVDEFVAPPEEPAPPVFQSRRLDPNDKKKSNNEGGKKAASVESPPKEKLVSYRIQQSSQFSELDILLGRESGSHSSQNPEAQHEKAMAMKTKKVVEPKEIVKIDQVDLPAIISLTDLSEMSHIPIEALLFTMGKVHSSRLADIGEEQDLPGCVLAYKAGQGPIMKRALKELSNAMSKTKFQSREDTKKIARRAAAMLVINRELAANVMFEHDILSEYLPDVTTDDEFLTVIDRESPEYMDYPSRPPVVTIMGHVDHGKTTLLDTLRNANVAASESGGITQAVGAFNVFLKGSEDGEKQRVVFVDTPGHAAFAKMRKNGAAVTDIIVLIVAATDGLQPQTIESIELAQASNIPLVVALTKIDMPGINQETALYGICADLQLHGVLTEHVGGTVPVIPISAPNGIGLDDLTEALVLQAEMMELHSPTDYRGEAVVLESFFDSKQGQMIDAIVRCGTLKPGDEIIVADQTGRIRALLDPVSGKQLQQALPSTPVRIVGLKDAVPSGSTVIAIADAKRLNKVLDARKRVVKMDRLVGDHKVIRRHRLEAREKARIATTAREVAMEAGVKHSDYEKQVLANAAAALVGKRRPLVVPIVLKADTDGSLAALRYSIEGLTGGLCSSDEEEAEYEEAVADGGVLVNPPLLLPPGSYLKMSRMGVGPITPQDIDIAETLGCHVYGFNVRANHIVTSKAAEANVILNTKSVIYHLLDDLKKDLLGQMGNVTETTVKGSATVLKVFTMNGKQHGSDWSVAGCKVELGTISFSSKIRVVRDGKVIHTASGVDSLKKFKDEVKSVEDGDECGISLTGFQEFKQGDKLQSYDEKLTEFSEAINRKK